MNRKPALVLALGLLLAPLAHAASDETVDWGMMTRIRDEAFSSSKVMETLSYLTDVHGPRLTGSPTARQAGEWARKQLEEWGLQNAHLESFPFGRGWSYEHVSVHMLSPSARPLIAYPLAWTPGTDGPVRAKVTKVKLESDEDLEKNKGKLAGAILFLAEARDLSPSDKPLFTRLSEKELEEIELFQIPGRRPGQFGPPGPQQGPRDPQAMAQRFRFQRKLRDWLKAEKVVATVNPSERDGNVVRVGGGGSREKNEDPGVLGLVMAAEHYNQLVRILEKKLEVELEVDVKARFHDQDPSSFNVIAELPGTDKKAEVVMVGAHLDSWHSGTGATDNAAGSAVAMEAMRILKALDPKPRRTVRIGLWMGEEQGLLGSRAYVKEHFAERQDRPESEQDRDLPEFARRPSGPITIKPDHAKLAAYFNLDNGTGKIRGVYAQQNAAAVPVFEAWLKPFRDLGATTVSMRNTGGTDHLSFDGVGLPGFQFIQDRADYDTRTHHTNVDVYDRLQREDMMQASAIMAAFAYNAATRAEMFPRKPLPKEAVPAASPSPAAGKAAAPKPAPKPSPAKS